MGKEETQARLIREAKAKAERMKQWQQHETAEKVKAHELQQQRLKEESDRAKAYRENRANAPTVTSKSDHNLTKYSDIIKLITSKEPKRIIDIAKMFGGFLEEYTIYDYGIADVGDYEFVKNKNQDIPFEVGWMYFSAEYGWKGKDDIKKWERWMDVKGISKSSILKIQPNDMNIIRDYFRHAVKWTMNKKDNETHFLSKVEKDESNETKIMKAFMKFLDEKTIAQAGKGFYPNVTNKNQKILRTLAFKFFDAQFGEYNSSTKESYSRIMNLDNIDRTNGHLPITESFFNEIHQHYMNSKGIQWFISPKDYEEYEKKLSQGYYSKVPSQQVKTSEPEKPTGLNLKRPNLKLESFAPNVVSVPASEVNRRPTLSMSSNASFEIEGGKKHMAYGTMLGIEADGRILASEMNMYMSAINKLSDNDLDKYEVKSKARIGKSNRDSIKGLGTKGQIVSKKRLTSW